MHIITTNIDNRKKITFVFLISFIHQSCGTTTTPAFHSFGASYHFTPSSSSLSIPQHPSVMSMKINHHYFHYPNNKIKTQTSSSFFMSKLQSTMPLEANKSLRNQHYYPPTPKHRCKSTKLYGGGEKVILDHEKSSTIFKIFNAALLIAGTTIGGGFLALPTIVSRPGFIPSTVAIVCVWFYFLAQSFALVECIHRTKNRYNDNGDNDDSTVRQDELAPGVTAVVKSIYGTKGEVAVGILLTILIEATLVSQISRAGMLFSNYQLGCFISALSVALLVFGPARSGILFASKANAVLTCVFVLATLSVFGVGLGMGLADWSQLGRMRDWSLVPSILPTILQLLVYGEILPTVCQILQYNTRYVHAAIVMGSFMTLCLQIGWSALGTSLVAVAPEGAVSSAAVIDPVAVLLSKSGPARLPLFFLAITAILTTILGSYLALLSTYNDFVNASQTNKRKASNDGTENVVQSHETKSFVQRFKTALIISIPSSLIACTSPSVFLKAIDFAGSYPVLLLWGVLPPLMVLTFRSKMDHGKSSSERRTAGPFVWLVLLELVSLFMVGTNVFQDASHLWNNIMTKL